LEGAVLRKIPKHLRRIRDGPCPTRLGDGVKRGMGVFPVIKMTK
jgi:hypothetical protein